MCKNFCPNLSYLAYPTMTLLQKYSNSSMLPRSSMILKTKNHRSYHYCLTRTTEAIQCMLREAGRQGGCVQDLMHYYKQVQKHLVEICRLGCDPNFSPRSINKISTQALARTCSFALVTRGKQGTLLVRQIWERPFALAIAGKRFKTMDTTQVMKVVLADMQIRNTVKSPATKQYLDSWDNTGLFTLLRMEESAKHNDLSDFQTFLARSVYKIVGNSMLSQVSSLIMDYLTPVDVLNEWQHYRVDNTTKFCCKQAPLVIHVHRWPRARTSWVSQKTSSPRRTVYRFYSSCFPATKNRHQYPEMLMSSNYRKDTDDHSLPQEPRNMPKRE